MTVAANTRLKAHVIRQIHPGFIGVKLLVRTGNLEDTVQEEGQVILSNVAHMSYNVVNASLIPDLFISKNLRAINIGEIEAQF